MRYSNILHTSSRNHILKNYKHSLLVIAVMFGIVILVLSLLMNFSNLDAHSLITGFFVSLYRIAVSYLIASVVAIILALLITSNKIIENIFLPIFDVLQSFPSFALFPVLVIALKNSPEAVIILVLTITIIWPILFSIIGGVKNQREDFEEAATIFGATGSKRLFYFTLPQLSPAIVTGSIVGWGEGWEFIIGAELLTKTHLGIGSYLGMLGENQQNFELAFGIITLLLFLYIINKIIWLPLLNDATKYSTEG